MDFLNDIKAQIPDYAKDIRLNLDGTIARSSLSPNDAVGVALAASVAAKSPVLIHAFRNAGVLTPEEEQGVMTSAALMGMTNSWYTYTDVAADEQLKTLPAQLRMNAYANHGGVDKRRFELYALAASIVGKCKFCVASHFDILKKEGMSVEQLRDVGRIAAVVNAASQVLVAG
jgi:alkyl hydroperoxide reductase subunit D